MSKLTLDDAIDNPVTRAGEATNNWADEQAKKAKHDFKDFSPLGAVGHGTEAVVSGIAGTAMKTTGVIGGAVASGVHTAGMAVGDVSGDAAHAVQGNEWVEGGIDKMKDGGGHVVEGVKKLNPLNVFKGFGNLIGGIFTLDGQQASDGMAGIVSPIIGVGEMVVGTGEAAIGAGQATTGKISKETVNAAYYVGDKAGEVVNPARPAPQTQSAPIPQDPLSLLQDAAATQPLRESDFTIKSMRPVTPEPAQEVIEAPKVHATFKNAKDEKLAEKALKDIGNLNDGVSISKTNAVLKKLGAEQLTQDSGFDDLLKAEGIIKQATLDWKEQHGTPSQQHSAAGEKSHGKGRE